jgi:hypothetical protein
MILPIPSTNLHIRVEAVVATIGSAMLCYNHVMEKLCGLESVQRTAFIHPVQRFPFLGFGYCDNCECARYVWCRLNS